MSQSTEPQESVHFNSEPPTDELNPISMKLTELNNDCLERIFHFLSLGDLLTIAHTNKQLKPAADSAFSHNFGNKKFTFCFGHRFWYGVKNPIEINTKQAAVRLLRCFGHLIFDISVDHQMSKVIPQINRYCYGTLLEVTFIGTFGNRLFKCWKNPFAIAQTVRFNRCFLNGDLKKLNKWFPNMCNLRLYIGEIGFNCIAARFPHVEELKIRTLRHISNKDLKTVESIINLNPQIKPKDYFHLHKKSCSFWNISILAVAVKTLKKRILSLSQIYEI